MSVKKYIGILCAAGILWGCDKKNDDVVKPLSAENFPFVVRMDDEGGGEPEDEDNFSFSITLNDRVDPEAEQLGGKVIPLPEDVTVLFEIGDLRGFSQLPDYITGVSAFYETDDCNTQEVEVQFDATTGKGTVVFPKGVEEVEVEFETDGDYFNDNTLNTEERGLMIMLTGIQTSRQDITFNKATGFQYDVLDEEGIHGDWELDVSDATQLAAFKQLFGLVNEDIRNLNTDEVDKIEISVEYDEVKVVVELKETETVEECGGTEEVNKTIELEADLEDLTTLSAEGDIEFEGEVELDDGSIRTFTYSGGFHINGSQLELVLQGEYGDEETEAITLLLSK